ncbi:hypothetical protein IWZ01DRAFT_525311 [Phyllosticta capitalensis]
MSSSFFGDKSGVAGALPNKFDIATAYASIDAHLALASDNKRNIKIRRGMLRWAAVELEHVGRVSPRRDFTPELIQELVDRSNDPAAPKDWKRRAALVLELYCAMGIEGMNLEHNHAAPLQGPPGTVLATE